MTIEVEVFLGSATEGPLLGWIGLPDWMVSLHEAKLALRPGKTEWISDDRHIGQPMMSISLKFKTVMDINGHLGRVAVVDKPTAGKLGCLHEIEFIPNPYVEIEP